MKADSRKRIITVCVILLLIFAVQFWVAWRKQYTTLTMDYINFITLGRQLVEAGTLPTFLFPGKPYGGPVKPFACYFPGLFLGHSEYIPVIMSALYGTLLCLACYFLGRLFLSHAAGIVAMLFCAASDPFMLLTVYCYEHGFDVMFLIGLLLGFCVIKWVAMYQKLRVQPGLIYCFTTGFLAGLLFYTHPLGAANIIACAIFLLVAVGGNIFTWRVPVVASGAFSGCLPMILFIVRHTDAYRSWHSFAETYPSKTSIFEFLFSPSGYWCFLTAPSGNLVMRASFVFCICFVAGLIIWRAVKWCIAIKWRISRKMFLEGFPVNLFLYPLLLMAVITVFLFNMDTMVKVAGGGYKYGLEPWLWIAVMLSAVLVKIAMRLPRVGYALMSIILICHGWESYSSVAAVEQKYVKHYSAYKDDAARMLSEGHSHIMAEGWLCYIYYALGPTGLCFAEATGPWVWDMGKKIETYSEPSIIAKLNPVNLGKGSWDVMDGLRMASIRHSFREPSSGKVIPRELWRFDDNVFEDNEWELLCDDRIDTYWCSGDQAPLSLRMKFERPVELCRVVIILHNDEGKGSAYSPYYDIRIGGVAENGEHIIMTEGARYDGYFWDSGRIYRNIPETPYRLDVRFSPNFITELVIEEINTEDYKSRKISEIYLFEHDNVVPLAEDCLSRIKDAVRKHGIRRVLADRFVSAQIDGTFGDVQVALPAWFRSGIYTPEYKKGWPWFDSLMPVMREDTMIVIDSSMAGSVERLLEEDSVRYTQESAGPYSFYILDSGQEDYISELVWNGFSVVRYFNKSNMRSSAPVAPLSSLDAPLHFRDVASLVGVNFSPKSVARGESVEITYYWQIPDGWKYVYRRPMVFSHLVFDGGMLVDDHRLLTCYDHMHLRESFENEIFKEVSTLHIRHDAPLGKYALEIGLHFSNQRVPVSTQDRDVRIRRNAAWLDGIEVVDK